MMLFVLVYDDGVVEFNNFWRNEEFEAVWTFVIFHKW